MVRFKHHHFRYPETSFQAQGVQRYACSGCHPRTHSIFFGMVRFNHYHFRYPETLFLAHAVQRYACFGRHPRTQILFSGQVHFKHHHFRYPKTSFLGTRVRPGIPKLMQPRSCSPREVRGLPKIFSGGPQQLFSRGQPFLFFFGHPVIRMGLLSSQRSFWTYLPSRFRDGHYFTLKKCTFDLFKEGSSKVHKRGNLWVQDNGPQA